MLTFREGDREHPRGHALLFFRDAEDPRQMVATYLVVAPITMDIAKYLPPAFAGQMGAPPTNEGPTAYPLPPIPEKVAGGLDWLERMARARGDDLLDGGVLRISEPWQALQPVASIGNEYATACFTYLESAASAAATSDSPARESASSRSSGSTVDVDDLLLQVMSDREKIGRIARLAGTLRYAVGGKDQVLASETAAEMQQIGRQLAAKYRLTELMAAAESSDPNAGHLAELFVDRCYKMVDEDYGAIAEIERQIDAARAES